MHYCYVSFKVQFCQTFIFAYLTKKLTIAKFETVL